MRGTRWLIALALVGCVEDPQDPKTWIKKLDNPRDQKEAVRELEKLKDPAGVEPLMNLYRKSKDPEHLKAIAIFKDKRAIPLMVEALDYTEESCDNAATAANALGDTPDPSAIPALTKALTKPLPIKTRCNIVKLETMKTLQKFPRDPRITDALVKVLETPADEQDFFLNRTAAIALGKLADPKSVPALVRGLWMTGRGTDIFSECRIALLAIGEPAVDPLIQALQRKNEAVEADAKKYQFIPGIIAQKAAIVLGDLHAKKAVPALLEAIGKKDEGLAAGAGKGVSEHQAELVALGQIGDPQAKGPLTAIVVDPKRHSKERAAAAEALNGLGDVSALPALWKAAQTKFINGTTLDGEAGAVVAAAVTAYSRLADAENANVTLPKVPEEIADMSEVMANAKERLEVAKECKKDIACYAKTLSDKSSVKAEKAALMLPRLGPAGLAEIAKHVNHPDPGTRMAILFGIARYCEKGCVDCKKALEAQIEIDRTKPPLKGVVDEMRATLAAISSRS